MPALNLSSGTSDESIQEAYVRFGTEFGHIFSRRYEGTDVTIAYAFCKWAEWEFEYARRGFRPLQLEAFVKTGGYGDRLEGIGVTRASDEKPLLCAKELLERSVRKQPEFIDELASVAGDRLNPILKQRITDILSFDADVVKS